MSRRILGIVAALAVALAACGGDEGTTDNGAAATTAAPTPATDAGSPATTAGGGEPSGDVVKAAWIYVGPTNDGGWTTAHDNGRKAVEAALGDKVITTYKESIAEGPEIAQVIEDLVKDGNQIIFVTSFGFGPAAQEKAEKYPDVKFEWATGIPVDLPNFSTYYGASEEALYLTGMAAAAATESNIVGFVAPFPIPEVIRHINGYQLGMQAVNPDAVLKVVWVNSWFDPPKERQAAESLIAGGADVIANGGDSPAPGEAAKAAGAKWTGYNSDQSANFPEIWLTAALYDWGPYYIKKVEGVLNGTWEKQDYYGNIADGFTDIAPFGDSVSEDVRSQIEDVRQQIVDGEFNIFSGPIYDQAGTERIPEGETMDFDTQMSIDWFVQGVDGNAAG